MSLKAIATALGVSVTTVSRALGGYADVSASTRARVEAEARRRGYRPNTQARRLKTGKTDAVGLVYPGRDVPFNSGVFMDMVSCISRELAHHDIDLLLIADDEHADCHSYMRLVESRRVDALIIAHTLDDDPVSHTFIKQVFHFWLLVGYHLVCPVRGLTLIIMPGLDRQPRN